jgi:thioredoxin 2
MSDAIRPCPGCGTKNRLPAASTGRPRCAKCHRDLPWVVAAGDADLKAALDTPQLVLIDLWAPWCGPCRMVAPVLERLAERYAGRVKVVKVNVDEAPRAARRFEAYSIPTLVLVDAGDEVDRVIGARPEAQLVPVVERALRSRAPGP